MIYLRRNLTCGLAAICIVAAMGCLSLIQIGNTSVVSPGGKIVRQEPGGNSTILNFQVGLGDAREDVSVEIEAQSLTKEQVQKEFTVGKQYLLDRYLGENKSSQSVSESLVLEQSVPNSVIEVTWQLDQTGYICEDGELQIQEIEEPQQVEIVAILSYGEEREEIPIELTLIPPDRSKAEQLWLHWRKSLEEILQKTTEDKIVQLPLEVDGEAVRYYPVGQSGRKWVIPLGLALLIMFPFLLSSQLKQQLEEREQQLRRDYSEMVEQFVLLLGAGMTIKGAWLQIVDEYRIRRQEEQVGKRYLYEEMSVTVREMENGLTENKAYELFGRRTGILSYMKFSTLLVQNLRKGSADLLRLLEYEALDAFRERKEYAKKLGEEAGTKLLAPMMLMLLVVFAIILYAAFRSM